MVLFGGCLYYRITALICVVLHRKSELFRTIGTTLLIVSLCQAAWNGALDVIHVLLDAKANVDTVNKQGSVLDPLAAILHTMLQL